MIFVREWLFAVFITRIKVGVLWSPNFLARLCISFVLRLKYSATSDVGLLG